MLDILEQIQELSNKFSNMIDENVFNAIDKYVKDPEKREELTNRAHDIQQADDPDQKRFMEKNVHKMSGHGKEYQKHRGPFTADYPETGVYSGMDVKKTVDHLMNIAKSKAEDRYSKRRDKNRKFENKMNDNNSYNEIITQILNLKEAFSNLFEVEGLGDPSGDVPPSTNKIKRDIKTKDGKVELVSVENELFPYEGDKKEQYRKKVLDIINGMIQGTKTLEDLMQFVRQKKNPLKEAVEILESIINEKYVFPKKAVEDGNKKYLEADKKKNEATRLARKGFEKLNKKIKELEGKGIDTDVDIEPGVTYGNGPKKEYQQALKTADALHKAQREADREETKARNNQRKLRAEGLKGVVMRQFDYVPTKKGDSFNVKKVLDKNEALEEAMELLENLLDESKKEKPNYSKQGPFADMDKDTAEFFKAADEFVKKHKEQKKNPLKESINVLESLINEVSDETANAFLKKRVYNALDKNYNDDELNKKEENAVKALIKRKARQGKELSPNEKKLVEAAEKYTDNEGNVHELEFSQNKGKVNKYKFEHKINGKSVVSASDSEPNANHERKHAIKNYNLKKLEEAVDVLEALISEDKAEALNKLSVEFDKEAEGIPNRSKEMYDLKNKFHKLKKKVEKHYNKSEALEEALSILEGLFIADGRGDLFDDLTGAKGATGVDKIKNTIVALIKANKKANKKANEKANACENLDEAISLMEEIIKETSDERAHGAAIESHARYWRAKNAHDALEKTIKANKKTGFFNDEELKELKDTLKQKKKELENASRISVRDNRNQFNRDKRLGRN